MNQPTVLDPARPHRVGRGVQLGLGVASLAVVTAIALAFLADLSGGPSTVARITFENPTVYALDIEVSPGTGTGWTSAGSVRQQSTAVVQEIVDQGDVWLFRFDSQGEAGGELRFTRAQLEASGWRIAIPEEVGQRLADAGAPPTP